jgi:hypothetical protein
MPARHSPRSFRTSGRRTRSPETSLHVRARFVERAAEPAPTRYWLIVRRRRCAQEPLVFGRGGDRAILPVFGCKAEALSYLRYTGLEAEWCVGRVLSGEITMWLLGASTGVARIALDPPPDPDFRWVLDLISLEREEFVRSIT